MSDADPSAVPFEVVLPRSRDQGPLRVVIVGGGVAALEAALCLNGLAGDLVSTTIVAPDQDFVYLPMAVQDPFARPPARHYRLAQIATDAGAELLSDTLTWVESAFFIAHTKSGEQLSYDALLLAPGSGAYANLKYTITLDRHRLDEQLHGVLQDIEGGYVHTVAFLIPDGPVWPLPIYELALMTARRAYETSAKVGITIVTPEPAPLAVFGTAASDRVEQLLARSGITTLLSTQSTVHGPGLVAMRPTHERHVDPMKRGEEIHADRVIALPQLFGPHCPGVPTTSHRGFISTDRYGRVEGIDRTWAAGDATDFPVKFGGIAAQQADIAAQSIAALAGANVEPEVFRPELHGVLLTGEQPLILSAVLSGTASLESHVAEAAPDAVPAKIAARYLAPYLRGLDQLVSAV